MLRVVVFLLAFGFGPGWAHAGTLEDCNQSANHDRQISGCTKLIRQGRLSRKNLAIAYFNRGRAHAKKSQYDRAIADLTQAIKLNPKDDKAYNNRGIAYKKKADYRRAIADYDKAIKLNPRGHLTYVNRGNVYSDKGNYDRAIADYTQAIKLNPKFAEAYNIRSRAYLMKGQYDRAIADYDMVIKLNPKDDTAYTSRASAYDNKGDFERAIADYAKAISLNRRNTIALNGRANAYYDKGKHTRASMDYSLAILELGRSAGFTALNNRKPSDKDSAFFAKVLVNRGDNYQKLSDYSSAIRDYDEAIKLKPKYKRAYNNRALAHEKAGQREKAIADFRKIIELKPGDKVATNGLKRLVATPKKEANPKKPSVTLKTGSNNALSKEMDLTFWNSIRNSDDPAMLQAYLNQFPEGTFAALAKIKLGKLKKAQ